MTHFEPTRRYCGDRLIGLFGSFQASQSFTPGSFVVSFAGVKEPL